MASRQHQAQHARSTCIARKAHSSHARPSRPPPLRRGTSYNSSQSHSRTPSQSTSRAGSSYPKAAADEAARPGGGDDDDEGGMTSFLQFCATCERQIITPGTSILYCSEACRKRDVSRPTSLQSIESVRSPSGIFNHHSTSYFDYPTVDIVPQRSPTVLRPTSMTLADFSLYDKRIVPDESYDDRQGLARRESDPSRCIERICADLAREHDSRRPRNVRAPATTESNIPSLVHSPSSSYDTVASNASYRPLPSRHNPYTASFSTKSIDLVIPYTITGPSDPTSLKSSASTLTSFRVAEATDMSYEKKEQQRDYVSPDTERTRRHLFSQTPPRIDHGRPGSR